MAVMILILLAVCCVPAFGDFEGLGIDADEAKAIQDRLALLEGLEKNFPDLFETEEARADDCLPVGAGCKFGSGPNCCGLRTRCIIWDHYTPQRGGPANWHSVCREYNGGKALDNIGQFFKNLG